ncbi:MAG: hypothetical protein JXA13_10610 [Anaerolineales bacterium]|nr:hypothetical protein [Anaerolineales bacterium]
MKINREKRYQQYKLLRSRWDKEDDLLLTRTGIFLTTNSILLAASRFNENLPLQVGVASLGLLLSILWLTTSWHSARVIKQLFLASKDVMPKKVRNLYSVKPILFRPTTVFAFIVPSLIILGWIAYLAWILLV